MDDQHRFDWFGFAGHPVARTPNLDRIAGDGVVFDNAYTPAPLCIPARQCMAAGKLPRTCGVEQFGEDLPPNYETFARSLARGGYMTTCCGKLHHAGTDQMQGWTRRICNGDDMQVHGEYIEGRDEAAYEHFAKHPGMWSLSRELQKAGAGRSPYAVSDELNTAGACAFVEEYFVSPHYERATPERPLLLKLSLQQPHYPFCAPQELIDKYIDKVSEYKNQHDLDHPEFRNWTFDPKEVSADDQCRALAATAAMVEMCDGYYGQVLDKLKACGQNLDDWLIIYASDHGDLLGEHGKWWKMSFYEGSVKVPLVMRAPRLFKGGGRRIRENVNLCDLFATLCDAADLPLPEGTDSRTLLPLLRGESTGWPDESVSQYSGRCLMIKNGDLKYQYYGDNPDWPEVLFDLASDPDETVNAVNDPAYAEAMVRFRERRKELKF
jgi:choline-sulfatase